MFLRFSRYSISYGVIGAPPQGALSPSASPVNAPTMMSLPAAPSVDVPPTGVAPIASTVLGAERCVYTVCVANGVSCSNKPGSLSSTDTQAGPVGL